MRVLIVGLGSIAQKHIKALQEIDQSVEFIALRSGKSEREVNGVENIYSLTELKEKPDFVIISNPTNKHFEAIKNVLPLNTPLFVEKPVLDTLNRAESLLRKINKLNTTTYIGCNLRFHPCIQFLKENLGRRRLYEANIYSGSYLPDWRANRDYRDVYSAKSEMGGGVHLDLIHEVDYSYWLWGEPNDIDTSFRKISDLEINSMDYAHYSMKYPDKNVHITLNYYRKQPKRMLELVLKNDVWNVNLLENEIFSVNEKRVIFSSEGTMIDTYKSQMKYFLDLLKGEKDTMNNFRESLQVLKICLNEYS